MDHEKPERIFEYDFMRFVAISSVMMIHCAAIFVIGFYPPDIRFLAGNILDSVARLGVPFFVLLSGLFMLDENKALPHKKLASKIGKLFILLIVWNTFYALIFHNKEFVHYLFYGHYHLWYLYVIIGLYFVTPVLRLFVKEENKKVLYYFIVLAIIFNFLPGFVDFCYHRTDYVTKFFNLFQMNFVLGYTSYYILGRLISIDFEKIVKYKKYLVTLGIMALLTMIIGMELYTTKTIKAYNVFLKNMYIPIFIYSTTTFIFLVYLIRKNAEKFSAHIKQFITSVSKLSLGMYLIHVYILETMRDNVLHDIFSITMKNSNPFVYIVMTFLVTFILSYLIIFVLSKIKYVNKLVKL